jgi:hypothetical protein
MLPGTGSEAVHYCEVYQFLSSKVSKYAEAENRRRAIRFSQETVLEDGLLFYTQTSEERSYTQ